VEPGDVAHEGGARVIVRSADGALATYRSRSLENVVRMGPGTNPCRAAPDAHPGCFGRASSPPARRRVTFVTSRS
jgi:hypothetical protein